MNKPTEDEEQKLKLEHEAVHALVNRLWKNHWDTLMKETNHVEKIQRWLVVGRVVSALFQNHFKLAYSASEEANKHVAKEGL